MPGTTLGRRLLRRLARGRAPRGAPAGHRGEGPPAEPMTALCGLDQSGFLDRCRSARGGSDPPGLWPGGAGTK